jgi:hypothetical protein
MNNPKTNYCEVLSKTVYNSEKTQKTISGFLVIFNSYQIMHSL